ncbi:MAG: hypothetical protein GF320_19200 [Armatimonadia bacterium]|nr:hypothetical protein [Armatimonadia bacterium]
MPTEPGSSSEGRSDSDTRERIRDWADAYVGVGGLAILLVLLLPAVDGLSSPGYPPFFFSDVAETGTPVEYILYNAVGLWPLLMGLIGIAMLTERELGDASRSASWSAVQAGAPTAGPIWQELQDTPLEADDVEVQVRLEDDWLFAATIGGRPSGRVGCLAAKLCLGFAIVFSVLMFGPMSVMPSSGRASGGEVPLPLCLMVVFSLYLAGRLRAMILEPRRRLVVSTGALGALRADDALASAVLSHELTHLQRNDPLRRAVRHGVLYPALLAAISPLAGGVWLFLCGRLGDVYSNALPWHVVLLPRALACVCALVALHLAIGWAWVAEEVRADMQAAADPERRAALEGLLTRALRCQQEGGHSRRGALRRWGSVLGWTLVSPIWGLCALGANIGAAQLPFEFAAGIRLAALRGDPKGPFLARRWLVPLALAVAAVVTLAAAPLLAVHMP